MQGLQLRALHVQEGQCSAASLVKLHLHCLSWNDTIVLHVDGGLAINHLAQTVSSRAPCSHDRTCQLGSPCGAHTCITVVDIAPLANAPKLGAACPRENPAMMAPKMTFITFPAE